MKLTEEAKVIKGPHPALLEVREKKNTSHRFYWDLLGVPKGSTLQKHGNETVIGKKYTPLQSILNTVCPISYFQISKEIMFTSNSRVRYHLWLSSLFFWEGSFTYLFAEKTP